MLIFVEGRKQEKTPQSKDENQQQNQTTYSTGGAGVETGNIGCFVPRRRSLVERDALWVMELIVRGLQGVPRAPCFPAIPPLTQLRLGPSFARITKYHWSLYMYFDSGELTKQYISERNEMEKE